MDTGYLGTDIAYHKNFDMLATGDTNLASGINCLSQDLLHALTTPKGDLWYDETYGVDIYKYLKGENTETQRLALELEIIMTLEADPRVVTGSAVAQIVSWNLHKISIKASCKPIAESNRLNMVLGYSPSAFTAEVTNGN